MPKRVLTGTVVSDKPEKTVVVRVERRVKHPLYGKIIKLSEKKHAHDAANEVHVGEGGRLEESPPLSKSKSWAGLHPLGAAKAAKVEIVEPDLASQPASEPAAEPSKPAEEKAEKKPAKKPAKKAKAEDVAEADADAEA